MYMCIHARNNETEAYSSDKIMPMLATTSRSGRGTVTIYRQRVSLIDTFFPFPKLRYGAMGDRIILKHRRTIPNECLAPSVLLIGREKRRGEQNRPQNLDG